MSNLFTRLNTTYSGYDLPTVDRNDIVYFSELEENAVDHWIFDKGTSAGLIGRVNGLSLTAQSTAPTYESNAVLVDGTVGKALLSNVSETGSDKITVFCVTKSGSVAGNPQPLIGNFNNSGGGFMLSDTLNTGDLDKKIYMRGTTNANPSTVGAVAPDIWTFAAITINTTGASKLVKALVNASIKQELTVTGTYVTGAQAIGLGNGFYTSASVITKRYAEFGIIKDFYTLAQLEDLYNRSKARMALRGITLL